MHKPVQTGHQQSHHFRGQAKDLAAQGKFYQAAIRQFEAYKTQQNECPPRPNFEGEFLPGEQQLKDYFNYWVNITKTLSGIAGYLKDALRDKTLGDKKTQIEELQLKVLRTIVDEQNSPSAKLQSELLPFLSRLGKTSEFKVPQGDIRAYGEHGRKIQSYTYLCYEFLWQSYDQLANHHSWLAKRLEQSDPGACNEHIQQSITATEQAAQCAPDDVRAWQSYDQLASHHSWLAKRLEQSDPAACNEHIQQSITATERAAQCAPDDVRVWQSYNNLATHHSWLAKRLEQSDPGACNEHIQQSITAAEQAAQCAPDDDKAWQSYDNLAKHHSWLAKRLEQSDPEGRIQEIEKSIAAAEEALKCAPDDTKRCEARNQSRTHRGLLTRLLSEKGGVQNPQVNANKGHGQRHIL